MSTKSHNVRDVHSSSDTNRLITSTDTENGRKVSLVECRNPASGQSHCYDITVVKANGDMDVVWSGNLVGEGLVEHFRLVTKYGGVAKPKPIEAKDAEKHRVLDEIIEALESPNGKEKTSKSDNLEEDYRNRGLAENIYPRRTEFNILELDFENSAVDVMKALGWDWTVAGRQSVAMTLGYRGKISNDDRSAMNDWLVKEINRRFGYELRDRLKKARAKAAGPVFTPLDWDAHMEELDAAAHEKPSPKKSKASKSSEEPDDNMDYIAETQRLKAKADGLARMRKTPMVKNMSGVYAAVKSAEVQTKADIKALKDKPKKKRWQKVLDTARQHLKDNDDWTAEELTTEELEQELIGLFEDHYGDDWDNLSKDEVYEIIDEHWV